MRAFIAVIVLAGSCRRDIPIAPANQVESTAEPVERADEIHRELMRLDYERPFSSTRRDDLVRRARALYMEACRSGVESACWKAGGEGYEMVEANCRNGHQMSCRATFSRDPGLPGAAARVDACIFGKCDIEALRVECSKGFTQSCDRLYLIERSPALRERVRELSIDGCRQWVTSECNSLQFVVNDDSLLEVAELSCMTESVTCLVVAERYLKLGNKARSRDLFERACQLYTMGAPCLVLGLKYVSKELPEPVPGRGQRLIDFECARIESPECPER
jgi:hypothetical protein